MWPKYAKRVDLESGGPSALYPGMIESPDLRWAFIRKIYTILTVQLALTAAVAAVVVSVKSISHFFVSSSAGLGLYIFLIILPFILLCPLYIYRERHPVNLLLLGLFTLSISFAVGMSCAFTSGFLVVDTLLFLQGFFLGNIGLGLGNRWFKDNVTNFEIILEVLSSEVPVVLYPLDKDEKCRIDLEELFFLCGKVILEAAILTTVVVVSLTLYTFWAARRGHDFNFLGPFLFAAVLVLLVFGLIQILFPLGKLSVMIYGGLGALIFSGYIIYDTDNLIKRFTYDQYVWAAVSLYLDVVNLFLSLLTLLRAADS